MVNFRKKECFKCRFGTYTKIGQTEHSMSWKVEEPGGTIAYEVWDIDHIGSRMPTIDVYGKIAFYSRSESDVDFWVRDIERRAW